MSIHRSKKTTDISSPDSFLHAQLPNSTTQLQSSTRNATNIELPLPPPPTQLQPADLHALYQEISKITAKHFGSSSHVSLLVKDLCNITSFIECFPNTPSGFDGYIYERQRNAEAEIANSPLLLGNGLRPAIIALQMTGTFTPYQRDYVRYLHARFPQLLKEISCPSASRQVYFSSSWGAGLRQYHLTVHLL